MNWRPNIFRRRKPYDDLGEEIRLHIEERAEQLMREGMSREEAQRKARVAFGRDDEVWVLGKAIKSKSDSGIPSGMTKRRTG